MLPALSKGRAVLASHACHPIGPLAHAWLEQRTHNPLVPCSTHGRPTRIKKANLFKVGFSFSGIPMAARWTIQSGLRAQGSTRHLPSTLIKRYFNTSPFPAFAVTPHLYVFSPASSHPVFLASARIIARSPSSIFVGPKSLRVSNISASDGSPLPQPASVSRRAATPARKG